LRLLDQDRSPHLGPAEKHGQLIAVVMLFQHIVFV
jgi:hypothetical protein